MSSDAGIAKDRAKQASTGGVVAAKAVATAEPAIADDPRRGKHLFRIATGAGTLLVVAAVVVLLSIFVLPTFRIYGTSMSPTLHEGEIVVSLKAPEYRAGDIVAFHHDNKILVKRVICGPGDWFSMQEDGMVFVNNVRLDEPYVTNADFGDCDLEMPYQVPEGEYFVMGDQRATSIDSRMSQIGCVPQDRILGKAALRVWPLDSFGLVG